MTAAFRTFVRGLWQRDGTVSFALSAAAPQPIALFQGEASEVILDVFDELGMPVDVHTGDWLATLRVKKQFDDSPAVVSVAGALLPQINRILFSITSGALSGVTFGRYAYNIILQRDGDPAVRKIVVPPSLFEITPTIQ